MTKQLLLNIHLHDHAHFENFYFTKNALAVHTLKRLPVLEEYFIYLWGSHGVGKTHLLQACCHEYQKNQASMIYLPLKQYQKFSPDMLTGLDQVDLICLDDVDHVLSDASWTETLFHCYNNLQQYKKKLIVSAAAPPKQLSYILPDLQSRYMQGITLTLKELTDSEKIYAIRMRAKNRGLILPEPAAEFLMRRCPRNLKALFHMMHTLEEASLREQRRITIPFIKKLLRVPLKIHTKRML
jgi:DnaA family protein